MKVNSSWMGPQRDLESSRHAFAEWGHGETSSICNQKFVSHQVPTSWCLDPGRPVSRAVRNKRLLFKPPGVWYFCCTAWAKTEKNKEGQDSKSMEWSTPMAKEPRCIGWIMRSIDIKETAGSKEGPKNTDCLWQRPSYSQMRSIVFKVKDIPDLQK